MKPPLRPFKVPGKKVAPAGSFPAKPKTIAIKHRAVVKPKAPEAMGEGEVTRGQFQYK